MMLAHTRLLVPKKFPSRRDADISTANEVKPEKKTARNRYRFCMRYSTLEGIWAAWLSKNSKTRLAFLLMERIIPYQNGPWLAV